MVFRTLVPLKRESNWSSGAASTLGQLHDEMSQLFDAFAAPALSASGMNAGLARLDMREDEKNYIVSAEMPGMAEKDINVELHEGLLTLSGEKKAESHREETGLLMAERAYGKFSRTISLPGEVMEDKIDATFKNGVLTVTLPKAAPAPEKVKKIAVKNA